MDDEEVALLDANTHPFSAVFLCGYFPPIFPRIRLASLRTPFAALGSSSPSLIFFNGPMHELELFVGSGRYHEGIEVTVAHAAVQPVEGNR